MKYLVICIHPRDGATVVFQTDDKNEAIRECNLYNRECTVSRYTIYSEADI